LEVARIRHGFLPDAFGDALKEEIANQAEEVKFGVNVLDSYDSLTQDNTDDSW